MLKRLDGERRIELAKDALIGLVEEAIPSGNARSRCAYSATGRPTPAGRIWSRRSPLSIRSSRQGSNRLDSGHEPGPDSHRGVPARGGR